MSEYPTFFIILIVFLLIVLIWTQFCLMQTNKKIINLLKASDANMNKQLSTMASIEYVITGESEKRGKMFKEQWLMSRNLKLIVAEVRFLRKLWEFKNRSAKTNFEDMMFRRLKLEHHRDWLEAIGVEGDNIDIQMEKYRKILSKYDEDSGMDE